MQQTVEITATSEAKAAPSTGSGSVTAQVAVALVVAQCCGGAWSIASRQWIAKGHGVGYCVFLAYRYFASGTVLFGAAWHIEGCGFKPPRHVGAWEILLLSSLSVIASVAFLIAVGSIGSFLPALCGTLIPVYVCGVCMLCRIEAIRRSKAAGIFCAVVGAVLVVAREEMRRTTVGGFLETSEEKPHVAGLVIRHISALWLERPTALSVGLAMLVVHIFAAGTFVMVKKDLLSRSTPLHLSACAFYACALVSVTAGIVTGRPLLMSTWRPSTKNMYALVFSLFESSCGTGLAAWAMKRTNATNVVASLTLQPVTSALISWAVLHTPLQGDHILGMTLTSVGLLLVVYSQVDGDDSASSVETKMVTAKLLP